MHSYSNTEIYINAKSVQTKMFTIINILYILHSDKWKYNLKKWVVRFFFRYTAAQISEIGCNSPTGLTTQRERTPFVNFWQLTKRLAELRISHLRDENSSCWSVNLFIIEVVKENLFGNRRKKFVWHLSGLCFRIKYRAFSKWIVMKRVCWRCGKTLSIIIYTWRLLYR